LPYIGNGKFDAAMVNWRTWIEYAVNIVAGANCRVSRTANGNRIDVDIPEIFQIGSVTTAASARPGSAGTYSTDGVASLYSDGGASPLTLPTGATSVRFKNCHDKGFKVGAMVGLIRRHDGTYWGIDIDSCTNLV
jgi:hypothetical protein